MRQEISTLYNSTIKNGKIESKINEFIYGSESYQDWIKHLYSLEQHIGGIGIHNVNQFSRDERIYPNTITGNYHVDDRPIFRPIQYCSSALLGHFIIVDTRYLVDNSCAHIEGILKKIFKFLKRREYVGIPITTVS